MKSSKRAARLAGICFASLSISLLFSQAIAREIIHNNYDANPNDLLTGGLGSTGLGSATAPAPANPLAPAADELRKIAIYTNYRALVDPTRGGGYGSLYGPAVPISGTDPLPNDGRIAGDEYITFDDGDGSGKENVTLMVQIPSTFDPNNACLITGPSSGSRGIYGAIATAGEWGLKHGCAVAYTDKGSGIGADDLQNNKVDLIQGQLVSASQAKHNSIFTAKLTGAALGAFNAANPNRFAFKHAHSQENPEQDWGRYVLDSIRFAFEILGQKYGGKVTKRNTIVISASVSNGGGASLRAAERDKERLIDGVAVAEPNVNPVYSPAFVIQQGNSAPIVRHSRPLIDYITLLNVYQGCANGASANANAPLNFLNSPALTAGRCASLHALGLLQSAATDAQAAEAQAIINNYGILPEQNLIQPGYWFGSVARSISMTYANAYSRSGVADNICNFSFAAIDAGSHPAPASPAAEAIFFGTLNGIPPSGSVGLINNAADGGPAEDRVSVNKGVADQNLNGALCLRSIATGKDAVTGEPLGAGDPRRALAARIDTGVAEILAAGRLHGIPAIIVTGRNDGILPPNFASRAYYGLNKTLETAKSPLYYYEVLNASHLDSFNQFPGYDANYIPLHRYYLQALDLMYGHLKNKSPLPPSQIVRTTPRGTAGGIANPITLANVPPISPSPAGGDVIQFTPGKVFIPN
jgi:hydroxybutyrate-dimer hydrolase